MDISDGEARRIALKTLSRDEDDTLAIIHPNYIKLLKDHLRKFPTGHNFIFEFRTGQFGLGEITCLQEDCYSTISSTSRENFWEGGKAMEREQGFGGLAMLQSHLENVHRMHSMVTHDDSRDMSTRRKRSSIYNANLQSHGFTDFGYSSSSSSPPSSALSMSTPGTSSSLGKRLAQIDIDDTEPTMSFGPKYKRSRMSEPSEFELTPFLSFASGSGSPSISSSNITFNGFDSVGQRRDSLQHLITEDINTQVSPTVILHHDANTYDVIQRSIDDINRTRKMKGRARDDVNFFREEMRNATVEEEDEKMDVDVDERNLNATPSGSGNVLGRSSQLQDQEFLFPLTMERIQNLWSPRLPEYLPSLNTGYPTFNVFDYSVVSNFGNNFRDQIMVSQPSDWSYASDIEMEVDMDGVCGRGMGPVPTTEELEKIFAHAMNTDGFEGSASVEEARIRLGLKHRQSVIPNTKLKLMPHQIVGVDFMVQREKDEKRNGTGGLMCDAMGLGKTIQSIATILLNRPPPTDGSFQTLIVAPLALLEQWRREIVSGNVACLGGDLIRKRKPKQSDLERYDIILTTYHTLIGDSPDDVAERAKKLQLGKKVKEAKGLFLIKWFRVILDEAQNIRNKATKAAKAVFQLESEHRWALTGTPIINYLMDCYSLLKFLQVTPWSDFSEFNKHIGKMEKSKDVVKVEEAANRLQTILKGCMIRRGKDSKIDGRPILDGLPKKTVINVPLEFSGEEREIYNVLEAKAQEVINKFIKRGTLYKNYSNVLVLLLRLRQLCCHPALIQENGSFLEDNNKGDEDDMEAARRILGDPWVKDFLRLLEQKALEEEGDTECPICTDLMIPAKVTECKHQFCNDCLDNYFATQKEGLNPGENECPMCRQKISKSRCFNVSAFEEKPKVDGLPQPKSLERFLPSTKMTWMMSLLQEWQQKYPDEKVLIVSQFVQNLDLISEYLAEQGMKHVRYDGSMTASERDAAVLSLQRPAGCMIMLMSLKAGGVGLNLCRANRILSMDFAWSPAVEAQAFDRVHRIGQERDVFVYRPQIINSVEQRMLGIQERKQSITDHSLGEGKGKKIGRMTTQEIAYLFNLDAQGELLQPGEGL